MRSAWHVMPLHVTPLAVGDRLVRAACCAAEAAAGCPRPSLHGLNNLDKRLLRGAVLAWAKHSLYLHGAQAEVSLPAAWSASMLLARSWLACHRVVE